MGNPKRKRFAVLAGGMLLALIVAALARPAYRPAAGGQEPGYVGMEQCAQCHDAEVAAFSATIHGKKGFALPSSRACETCHGPGKVHVENGGEGGIITAGSLAKDKRAEMCLSCHDRGTKMFWRGSSHDLRSVACQDCHSVHHPASDRAQLKEAVETDVCFGCHKQKKAQFFRASHHPIREGKIDCADCHNPHGTQSSRLIDADSVTERCYKCHAEKRGPFLWEHPPVREDCLNCHVPHGSNHMKLLAAKEPFLCQRCHSDTRHPGTIYDQSQISNLSNRALNRSCTNCHATSHGSNHPSGATFLR